jgi:hypothetical protein
VTTPPTVGNFGEARWKVIFLPGLRLGENRNLIAFRRRWSTLSYPVLFISFRDEALESALGGFTAILTRHATEAAAGVAVHYVEAGNRA